MSKPEVTQIHFNGQPVKPDIDDLLIKFRYATNKIEEAAAKQAIYSLLAAEAVKADWYVTGTVGTNELGTWVETGPAIPLSKLKAIMEIKE